MSNRFQILALDGGGGVYPHAGGLRLGRGGIPPLAFNADGICASVSWRAAIVEVLVAVEVAAGVAFAVDPL